MKRPYRVIATTTLRGFMRATDSWPLRAVFRDQRLAVDNELNQRAIEEVGDGWPCAAIGDVN